MNTIRTILCPIELQSVSDKAANYAATLARLYGGRLYFLHVIAPPPTATYEYLISTSDITEGIDDASYNEMKMLADTLEAEGIDVGIDMWIGDVSETIKQYISFVQPDLLVMGTHGRLGITRWFMGSVTESIMRNSLVPVLTVSPRTKGELAFRRILVTTDFSSGTTDALDYACCIAHENGSEITVLHVVDDTNTALSIRYGSTFLETAWTKLESLIPADVRKRCRVSTKVEAGTPYRAIVRTLESMKADLLIMNRY